MNLEQYEQAIMPTKRRRLVELIIDPSSGQLSMSRLCVGIMNLAGLISSVCLALNGNGQWAATIITGVAATDAGIYFGSTRKSFGRDEN